MKTILLAAALALSGCAGVSHLAAHPDACSASLHAARTPDAVLNALTGMGVEKGLAAKTMEALMTSRLSISQVCASLRD